MSNGLAAPVEVARQPGVSVSGAPVFDARTFDEAYFTSASNYAGKYDAYNPPHKIVGYLREIRHLRHLSHPAVGAPGDREPSPEEPRL